MDEPAVVRCAECGGPGADRSLALFDKRFSTGPTYCRKCYEKLASRMMRPEVRPLFDEKND